MTLVILLTLYCLAIVVASLVGGYLPLVVRLTHRHLEMAISFVSGVILGVGLLHLLPHAAEALHGVEPAMAWMLGGFLLMFFLDRFFHFHLHEAPAKSDPLACLATNQRFIAIMVPKAMFMISGALANLPMIAPMRTKRRRAGRATRGMRRFGMPPFLGAGPRWA